MAGAVPFLTAKHAHHSAVWTIKGFSIDQLCVACSVEHLEDGQILDIQVKRILGELLGLLKSGDKSLYQVISADKRVQEHLINVIFGKRATHPLSLLHRLSMQHELRETKAHSQRYV